MKRIFALLIAALVLLSSFAALADDEPAAETPTTTTPLVLDNAISLSGLETGDTVNFYQVLEYNQNATTTGGWVATDAFKKTDSNPNGLDTATIQKMLGLGTDGKPATDLATNSSNYGISAELAAQLANIAKTITLETGKYKDVAEDNKVATVSNPDAGLYLALVTPGNAATLYNPIFVGADYKSTNDTNSIAVPLGASYSPASIAKKSTITLEKTASTTEEAYEDRQPETVAVGDTVNFTVETNIPVYANNYTEAVFTVVDTLSAGLELDTTSIAVYEGKGDSKTALSATTKKTINEAETTITNYTIKDEEEQAELTSDNKDGYAVVFGKDYILGDGRGKEITITYSAKVTTSAPKSVNLEKNTVEVHFSNNPTDSTGGGKLKDETKHYTFDIDADILGSNNGEWETTEVVKVGVGPDGKEIYEKTTTLHENQTKVGALAGATFKLYHLSNEENKDITINGLNSEGAEASLYLKQYTNDILTANDSIVSDDDGRLDIKKSDNTIINGIRGLDIGTYYLVEETAPAGYIRYQKAVKIEIIAPKPEGEATSNNYWELKTYPASGDILKPWSVWELKKYDVKIDGVETASYTFTNAAKEKNLTLSDDTIVSTRTDLITGADAAGLIGHAGSTAHAGDGKIVNTQGVELPHTGGIGTTLFYVGGSILVLAAVILLVTKRRMGGND